MHPALAPENFGGADDRSLLGRKPLPGRFAELGAKLGLGVALDAPPDELARDGAAHGQADSLPWA